MSANANDERRLRVLFVEDSEDDAELLARQLRMSGYELVRRLRVQTAEDMRSALESEEWDLVLSDFSMPSFTAPQALAIFNEFKLMIPFIIVSGTIGEEAAVAALRGGAHDFLVKGKLARFLPVVERELREAHLRRERQDSILALARSERRYRGIVETTQDGIWMLDGEGRTTFINRRMAEMLNCGIDDAHDARLLDFVDDDWKEQASRLLAETNTSGEVLFRRRDGSRFWGSLSAAPIVNDGEGTAMLAVVTDISDQRQLQTQLMVSDRMATVGALAAGIAHEINNPLAAVLLDLEIVARRLAIVRRRTGESDALKGAEEMLEAARQAANRVRDIVRDVKIFSRADDEHTAVVDIHSVLDSSLRIARNEIRHRATVTKHYRPIPPVEINESRLGQVFLNLLVNAAQSIPAGHATTNHVTITTGSSPDGRAAVEVTDSGVGMSPETMRRLFVPFFSTKPVGVGTGLGLSICHRIITAAGGEIQVESEEGRGSTFRVLLPGAESKDRSSAPEVAAEQKPIVFSKHGRILMIDDDVMVGTALQAGLAGFHDVTVVTAAKAALGMLRSGERFDAILCDVMMPEMTGIAFFQELSALDPEQARRLIFFTGGAFTPDARAFLAVSKNLQIEKPIDLDVLLRILEEQLSAQ